MPFCEIGVWGGGGELEALQAADITNVVGHQPDAGRVVSSDKKILCEDNDF